MTNSFEEVKLKEDSIKVSVIFPISFDFNMG